MVIIIKLIGHQLERDVRFKHKNRADLITRSFLQPRVKICDIRRMLTRLRADRF